MRPGRGARGEGGGNAPAAEAACQAPPMPAPAPEAPNSPTQALGLRTQPGQRARGKGAPGPPPTPPPSGQFLGHRPAHRRPVSPEKVPSVSWSQVTLPLPAGLRAHAALPWGELPRWGACAQPGPALAPARLPLFPLPRIFPQSPSWPVASSAPPPPPRHLRPPSSRLHRNWGPQGTWLSIARAGPGRLSLGGEGPPNQSPLGGGQGWAGILGAGWGRGKSIFSSCNYKFRFYPAHQPACV